MKKIRNVALLTVLIVSLVLLTACSSGNEGFVESRATERVVLTAIAVVNSDMGVEIDGERINYSASIIETLDANFTLVSPAMAESGFESGAYGAVITFPSDVSSRIVSFNTQHPCYTGLYI